MKSVRRVRKYGKGQYKCRRCGRTGGIIRKYNLNYCRQCMRDVAKSIGFKKFS